MTSWQQVTEWAPELAAAVRDRFAVRRHCTMATLRADGSPRISGTEVQFADGELWLGSMPGARKALDLRRDPRLALHAATVDKEVKEGDARITGRGVELPEGDEQRQAFVDHLRANGDWAPGGPFHLFRVDVTDITLIRIGDPADHLVIESWSYDGGYKRIERR